MSSQPPRSSSLLDHNFCLACSSPEIFFSFLFFFPFILWCVQVRFFLHSISAYTCDITYIFYFIAFIFSSSFSFYALELKTNPLDFESVRFAIFVHYTILVELIFVCASVSSLSPTGVFGDFFFCVKLKIQTAQATLMIFHRCCRDGVLGYLFCSYLLSPRMRQHI